MARAKTFVVGTFQVLAAAINLVHAAALPLPERYKNLNETAIAQQCFYHLAMQTNLRYFVMSEDGRSPITDAQLKKLLELATSAEIWRKKFKLFEQSKVERLYRTLEPLSLEATRAEEAYCIGTAGMTLQTMNPAQMDAMLKQGAQRILRANDMEIDLK